METILLPVAEFSATIGTAQMALILLHRNVDVSDTLQIRSTYQQE